MPKAKASSVRIIAGEWRGRKLSVLGVEGLRPSKDIIRETLFNWLQPVLPGSRVMDVFAGTGALGFEAASRHAAMVLMLEKSLPVAKRLEEHRTLLRAEQVEVIQIDAFEYLPQVQDSFDIVFLDPPFASDLLQPCCDLLFAGNLLHSQSRVYVEAAQRQGLPLLPSGWDWSRQKISGDVAFGLAVNAN